MKSIKKGNKKNVIIKQGKKFGILQRNLRGSYHHHGISSATQKLSENEKSN